MQISRIRLSDKTSRFSRATPSAVLEHYLELIGCPISMSFTTYCVCPELRPLPSTSVTRLQRYYEPLRHARAPGLSLTGFRLAFALATPWGFPCCVRFPCVHAVATTPAQRLGVSLLIHPSRISLPRYGSQVGLRIVLFEASSAFTRVTACTLALSPYIVTRIPKASASSLPPWLLRLLPAGAVAGWDLHPLESAALSRRTPTTDSCGAHRLRETVESAGRSPWRL
jgi:hypothetical protein